MKRTTAFLLGMTVALPAAASNWNTFLGVGTDTMLAYFDADTVTIQGKKVTLWAKYVYDPASTQPDRVYSTAVRQVFDCSNRTLQGLTSSSYDHDGNFIRTYSVPGTPQDIVPDSVGENILKLVCAKNFPLDQTGKFYSPAMNNNPLGTVCKTSSAQ